MIGVVAEVSCRYFREIGYPEPIEMGLRLEKLGTSSVIYRIGLFQGESTRRPPRGGSCTSTSPGPDRAVTPIPAEIRSVLESIP